MIAFVKRALLALFSLPSWPLFLQDELVSLARGLQEVKGGNWAG